MTKIRPKFSVRDVDENIICAGWIIMRNQNYQNKPEINKLEKMNSYAKLLAIFVAGTKLSKRAA